MYIYENNANSLWEFLIGIYTRGRERSRAGSNDQLLTRQVKKKGMNICLPSQAKDPYACNIILYSMGENKVLKIKSRVESTYTLFMLYVLYIWVFRVWASLMSRVFSHNQFGSVTNDRLAGWQSRRLIHEYTKWIKVREEIALIINQPCLTFLENCGESGSISGSFLLLLF